MTFLLGLLAVAAPTVAQAPAPAIVGTWHNPKNSVAVRTAPCGDKLCGWVVRASPKARAKVAARGQPPLVGTMLMRNYTASGSGRWQGDLWVPDRGRTVDSTVTLVDANTLSVRGCLLGGLFCRTQTWVRE